MEHAATLPADAPRRAAIGLAAMVAAALLTRCLFFGDPAPDYDEQLYSLIGGEMLHGRLPYVDLWDRKPLGLYLLYALAHAAGGEGPLGYQLLALGFCLVGGWLTYRIGRRISDPRSAAMTSVLYPVLMARYGSAAGQSEIFYVPLVMAMAELTLIARARPTASRALPPLLGAMALGGIAVQIKYSVVPSCGFFGLAALWLLRRKGWRWPRVTLAAAGFAILGLLPTLLAAAWYWRLGHFGDFVFANFVSITRRLPMPVDHLRFAKLAYALPLAMFAAGGLIQLHQRRGPVPAELWLCLGWLASAVAGLFLGTTVYIYYFATLIPAALVLGLPLFDRTSRLGPAILLAVIVGELVLYAPWRVYRTARAEHAALDQTAALIRTHLAGPADTLFVYDGPTALYSLTRSAPPTPLIYPDHLNNALEARALPRDPAAETRAILARRPAVIVTSPEPVTPRNPATARLVSATLAAAYRHGASFRLAEREVAVYWRR